MKDVVIVGALRTAIGCFQGALARHSAVELGSVVVKALVERSGIPAHEVDEVILGQVLTAGAGQNPARPGGAKRRPAQHRLGNHHQRRLWLRVKGAASCHAGHPVW
ncbi:acetyl-CoA acetyltransferase [Enterobacter cloacae]|uniref:Acetyl-CoA acetyltransferase n=1 Tax=Enterobacter cloacae TaxID=550 RepID=A0A377LTP8_ENTCL|nr:acetyl-CoA acetyltransferase [Enterobacter cloacae]